MNIGLRQLIPIPVLEIPHEDSGIWQAGTVVLEPGKKYLFTAISGKGKTSLLSILYGIRTDYEGDVYFDDLNIRGFGWREWGIFRKKQLSYIFQGLELFGDMTALENILLKNRQTGYYSPEKIREMAVMLEVDRYLDRKVSILSYGQKQRIAIIRALCQPFDFLFADEILSHLDSETGKQAFSLVVRECEKRNAGLLFTALQEPEDLAFDVKFRI